MNQTKASRWTSKGNRGCYAAEPTSSRPAWSGPTDTKTSGIVAEPTTLETEGIGSTKNKKLAQFKATLEMRAGGENFNERAELIRK